MGNGIGNKSFNLVYWVYYQYIDGNFRPCAYFFLKKIHGPNAITKFTIKKC